MSTATPSAASIRELMAGVIDYAGLFPPSSLEMHASVRNYARYRFDPQSWTLGRFVLPASRLDEFRFAQEQVIRGEAMPGRWLLTVVLSSSLAGELAAIQAFLHECRSAVIDSIDARISQAPEIYYIARHLPPETRLFVEIAPERAEELLPLIHRGGYCAKLRMGGTVPEAFPCVDTVADFLARCATLGVPLKATAGLHHPLRRVAPLTYERNSAKATMHGFLNLLTAAAIAWRERQRCANRDCTDADLHCRLAACLCDTHAENWQFTDDALVWSGDPDHAPLRFDRDALADMRANFALSFGSCSFTEPVGELRTLGFL